MQGELGMLKIPYAIKVLKVRRERPSADYAHCIFTLRQMTHVANGLSSLHLYGRTCLNILYIYIYIYMLMIMLLLNT